MNQTRTTLDARFKISDYLENGLIKTSLITDQGDANVKLLAEHLAAETDGGSKGIKISQLRKYYDDVVRIYDSKVDDDVKKVQLLMLKANCEYAAQRLKTWKFLGFFDNRIGLVVKKPTSDFTQYLTAFKMHFEALVAYFPKKGE